jgi:hypothetical protein
VALHLELGRSQGAQVAGTPPDLEDLPALAAVEVVVVVLARHLVAQALTRQFHGLQETVFQQGLDVAVHRGQPQAGQAILGGVQDLLGRKRAFRLPEDLAKNLALAGLATHGVRVHQGDGGCKAEGVAGVP